MSKLFSIRSYISSIKFRGIKYYCSVSSNPTLKEERYFPRLNVSPKSDMYDNPLKISVEGLEPSRPVTLRAEMREDKGKLLYSHAHYIADENGHIDLSFAASQSGSYKGVFPSGLLTCLKFSSDHYEFGRIKKNDMHTPVKIQILLLDGHQSIEAKGPELDSVEVDRYYMKKGVKRIPLRERNIRGVLYLPEGEGPFPGIIDMYGAAGSLLETRAALNASRGIASLALAYFHYEDIPWQRIHCLELEYFEEAADYLRSQPQVCSNACGVLANCFGGFLGSAMAIHLECVKAVYLINCPLILFFGKLTYDKNVLYETHFNDDTKFYIDDDGLYSPSAHFIDFYSKVTETLIERFNGIPDDKYLKVAFGEEDAYQFHRGWVNLQKHLTPEMRNRFTLKMYPKAGHIIHPPNSPFISSAFGSLWEPGPEIKKMFLKFGGDPRATFDMATNITEDAPEFFKAHLN